MGAGRTRCVEDPRAAVRRRRDRRGDGRGDGRGRARRPRGDDASTAARSSATPTGGRWPARGSSCGSSTCGGSRSCRRTSGCATSRGPTATAAWAFRISGDESNWFLRVVLVGQDAAVHDFPWPWDWFADTLRSQNDVPLHDYGTQGVSGYQCVLWNALSDAGREYREQVGSPPPQGVTTAEAGAITAGTPFTSTTTSGGPPATPSTEPSASRPAPPPSSTSPSTSSPTSYGTCSTGAARTAWATRSTTGTSATTAPRRADATNSGSPSTRAGPSTGRAR